MPTPAPKYQAFISYSHRDARIAGWLHRRLEQFPIPKNLIGRPGRVGPVPKRLFPIFRDKEEIPTSSDLGAVIRDALQQSAALIVICSPNSAKSRWVNEEVKHFRQIHARRPVLALIVDGEPNASDDPERQDEECFPPALRYGVDSSGNLTQQRLEPIAADIRPGQDSRGIVLLRLVAGLVGVDFDSLRQRERIRRRKRLAIASSLASAVLAVVVMLSVIAIRNMQLAEARRGAVEEGQKQLELSEKERFQLEYLSDMQSLPKLWNEDRADLIRSRLAKYDPAVTPQPFGDQRHFEWHYWDRRVHAMTASLEAGVGLTTLAWSADAKELFATASDGQFFSWQPATNLRKDVRHADSATGAVVADPSGKRLALLNLQQPPGAIEIVTADAFQPVTTLSGWPFTAMAFHPDGNSIVTGDFHGEVYLWDSRTGRLIRKLTDNPTTRRPLDNPMGRLDVHGGPVTSVAFHPDGQTVASVAEDGTTALWNSNTGNCENFSRSGRGGPFASVAFSPDGLQLVTRTMAQPVKNAQAAIPGEMIVWNADFKILRVENAFQNEMPADWPTSKGSVPVYSGGLPAVFGRDRSRIISALGTVVKSWDAVSGNVVEERKGHAARIAQLAIGAEAQLLASADESGAINIWDLRKPVAEAKRVDGLSPLRGLARNHDGARLAILHDYGVDFSSSGVETPGERKKITVLDGDREIDVEQPVELFVGLGASPDGKSFAAATNDRVMVWDFATGKLRHDLKIGDHMRRQGQGDSALGIRALTFADGGALCLLAGKTVWRCTLSNGRLETLPFSLDSEPSIQISPGANHLPAKFEVPSTAAMCVAFNQQGKLAVLGLASGGITILNVQDGSVVKELRGHSRGVTDLQFSRDGRRLISCSGRYVTSSLLETNTGPGEVIVWSTNTWQQCLTLAGSAEFEFTGVALDETGQNLLAAANRLTARGNKMPSGEVLAWTSTSATERTPADEPGFAEPLAGKVLNYSSLAIAAGGDAGFFSLAASPRGDLVAAVTIRGNVVIWNALTGEIVRDELLVADSSSLKIDFSADGNDLFASNHPYGNSTLKFNLPSGRLESLSSGPIRLVLASCKNAQGQIQLLHQDTDGRLSIVVDGKPAAVKGLEGLFAQDAVFSPNGSMLAVVTGQKTLHVVSVASGERALQVELKNPGLNPYATHQYGFSPDSRRAFAISPAASGEFTHVLEQWDLETKEKLPEQKLQNPLMPTPDLARCLEFEGNSEVFVRELASGKRSSAPHAVEPMLRGAAFFADGEHFATIAAGRYQVHLWSLNTPATILAGVK